MNRIYAYQHTDPLYLESLVAPAVTEKHLQQPIRVLLIEDADADATLTHRALRDSQIPFTLTRLKRGDEVLFNLARLLKPNEPHTVDVMLLDLELPGLDGFDVLADIAQMPAAIRAIPIVILTAHKDFEYMRAQYPGLNIVGYVHKPCEAHMLGQMIIRAMI